MSIPELKLKKIARIAALSLRADVASKESESKTAAQLKSITAKAKSYEDEYDKVCSLFDLTT